MADFATERLRVTRRTMSQSCPLSSCTSGSLSTPAGWLQGPGPGCLPLHWNSRSNLMESKGKEALRVYEPGGEKTREILHLKFMLCLWFEAIATIIRIM